MGLEVYGVGDKDEKVEGGGVLMEETVWGHLAVVLRANSKESVEYILETLWRTRKSGLSTSDRCIFQEMLHLGNQSDLDPVCTLFFSIHLSMILDITFILLYIIISILSQLLVCLRMLIRRCVYENTSKEDIPKLFPTEVLPELQKLLSLLLHKFQPEWQQDVLKDQNIVPRLKAMTWNMANLDKESAPDTAAVINLKLHNDSQFHSGEQDVKFQLATDSLDDMLKAMYCIRDQFSPTVDIILKFVLLFKLKFNAYVGYGFHVFIICCQDEALNGH
ncbi:hypothetical protein Fmac_001038 [Flemingia macrophylla]|uniref:COMM domain-containing protein n=1 Tax=Flemingia macrophylla TaxID=520843 RepID=A0ABD1NFY3_9FABA